MSDEWHPVPVEEGEYDELDARIGFDHFKCSECGALLRGGICLNACHLGPEDLDRFQNEMLVLAFRRKLTGGQS